MESSVKRCSTKSHWNKKATKFCLTCNKPFCEICAASHLKCDRKHELFSIESDANLSFTNTCKEENHPNKPEYFCKTHNNLCCAACLCKIKEKGDGQHTECNACHISEIKEEKKIILKNNIKILKELSLNIKKMLKEVKKIYEKTKPRIEDIKQDIKNIFNNLRKLIDKREKELLNEADNLFEKYFFNEEFYKNCKKLPNKIEFNLKRGKGINDKWEEDEQNGKLNLLINECINIEKNIEKYLQIKEKIKSLKSNSIMQFVKKDDDEEIISEKIKNFGQIFFNDYKFMFKKCPNEINIRRRFSISGDNDNIMTKKEPDFFWTGTTCLYEFKKSVEYKWKIKILESKSKQIMLGVVPNDFNIKNIDPSDFTINMNGWFFYCYDLRLYSGPPHNYKNKSTSIKELTDEIIIVMNMDRRTLQFMTNDKDKEIQYTDIPIDKPLLPAVCLFNCDKVEILEIENNI